MNRDTLIAFFSSELGLREEVQDDTLLFSTGLLDSFALVDLVAFIEKENEIKIGAMDVTLENLDSIERILALARSKLGDAAAG